MFDRIVLAVKVTEREIVHLVKIHNLQAWNNGKVIVYKTDSKLRNITGIDIMIDRKRVAKFKFSLHKYWTFSLTKEYRNDTQFTMREAKLAFEYFCFENGIIAEKIKIINYEIGLNLHVSSAPLDFIKKVYGIDKRDRILFIDANYVINRQKTTDKHDNIRKYFKIYDKGFEVAAHRYGSKQAALIETDKILRIETVKRRENRKGSEFSALSESEAVRFFRDWRDVFFSREIRACKGCKKSEIENAKRCFEIGAENYAVEAKKLCKEGKISEKQKRTITDFCKKWLEWLNPEKKFSQIISKEEIEYNNILQKTYNICKL
jgi:hypothetical protein